MVTGIAIIHLVLAILLVLITFVQDSKSDSLGGAFGGGGSNSLFGATGATTLIQKMTWWLAGLFAVTSISLAYFTTQGSKSVLDSVVLPPAQTAPANAGDSAPADQINKQEVDTSPKDGKANP